MDEVAPDGSPVAVFLAVPPEPEFTPVLDDLTPPATVLDLGCGVGRLVDPLVERGFDVTGVDESPAMLEHVRDDATTVRGRIEELDLGARFDVVVLASHLVNVADEGQRHAFLATAARHLADDGRLYVEHHEYAPERYDPAEGPSARTTQTARGELEIAFVPVRRDGDAFSGVVTYRLDGDTWQQAFDAVLLDAAALQAAFAPHGLRLERRLTPRWAVAGPAPG